jgi:Transcriptional regulator
MSLLTEKALAASLKKLLEKKTLDKITVKDITDDCGVNRQTFYYHFHDVYDLVEWIFNDEAKKFMADWVDDRSWKESVTALMSRLLEEKAFIMNTFFSINRRQLEKYMQGLARPALLDIAQDYAKGKNIADEDLEFVASVFTFALVGIMTEWVADGMSQEYQDKLDKFFLIIDGTMEATLAKFIQ